MLTFMCYFTGEQHILTRCLNAETYLNSLTQPFNLMSTENAVAISLELVHQGLGAADVCFGLLSVM